VQQDGQLPVDCQDRSPFGSNAMDPPLVSRDGRTTTRRRAVAVTGRIPGMGLPDRGTLLIILREALLPGETRGVKRPADRRAQDGQVRLVSLLRVNDHGTKRGQAVRQHAAILVE
jgi:hypothetical protein